LFVLRKLFAIVLKVKVGFDVGEEKEREGGRNGGDRLR
jgi:hypothetical protein